MVIEYRAAGALEPLSSKACDKPNAVVHGPGIVAHEPGTVKLVGAGPGNPALLTDAALGAIKTADLVVADRIVPAAILDLVECELAALEAKRERSVA